MFTFVIQELHTKKTLQQEAWQPQQVVLQVFLICLTQNHRRQPVMQWKKKKDHASKTSLINYNFFIGATQDNLDELCRVENIPGIKIYVGSSTGSLLVDNQSKLDQIFKQTPHLIAVHSEDEPMIQDRLETYKGSTNVHDHNKIRSAEGAEKCTKMLVDLALKHKKRLHVCHLTTAQEVSLLTSIFVAIYNN